MPGSETSAARPARKRTPRAIRIAVDAAMALALVTVMATATVEDAPHEYLGILLFLLVITHVVLNRRWVADLRRGRWTALRALQAASIAGVAFCLAGQVASSLVLSRHALSFLPPIPGSAWARRVHMLCSHWCFVLAFAHAGLQAKPLVARLRSWLGGGSALTAAWLATAAMGVASSARLNLLPSLLGQVAFAFVDASTPLPLRLARWGSVASLVAGTFHLLRARLERHSKEQRKAPQPMP